MRRSGSDEGKDGKERGTTRWSEAELDAAFIPNGCCRARGDVQGATYRRLLSVATAVIDTFPYSGFSTSLDALVSLTPVIALGANASLAFVPHAGQGSMEVGQTAALLHRVGLADLVAPTVDRFVDMLVLLAHDAEVRLSLREELREHLEALTDPGQVVDDLAAFLHRLGRMTRTE